MSENTCKTCSCRRKAVVAAVALAAAAFAVWGLFRYAEYRRDCADRAGADELRQFYRLAGDGNPAADAKTKIVALMVEMEKTLEACHPDMRQTLYERCLDGAFIVGDYAKAERMMDGLADKTPAWKEGAKAKVRAHAATERGDKAAAYKEFAAFVEAVKKDVGMRPEMDPYTGIEWSRDAILARNQKRLHDYALELGRKDEAAKHLAEAKASAKRALEAAKDDPASLEVLKREFKSLAD